MRLLRLVACHRTDNRVFLADYAVRGALDVALGFRGADFSFACGVLFAARVLPRCRAREVADGFYGVTLDRVVLASGFANNNSDVQL